jgi:hypothetical protein
MSEQSKEPTKAELLQALREASEKLAEAAIDIEDWGSYATPYIQQKHDLAETVAQTKADAKRFADLARIESEQLDDAALADILRAEFDLLPESSPAPIAMRAARAVQRAMACAANQNMEPIKDHVIAQTVNELRDIAVAYHAHGCLRELIARVVVPLLKGQRETGKDEFIELYKDLASKQQPLGPELSKISCEDLWSLYARSEGPEPECWCHKCHGNRPPMHMILCPTCGNKRCPKASDHDLACTDSNLPGQPGSVYPMPPHLAANQKGGDK